MSMFNDDEAPPAASTKGNGTGLVSIGSPTSYSRLNVALTADKVTAVVELNAAFSAVAREGLDLVAVLDVSGSMADDNKLGSMKKAMQFVIMKLTPLDRLSVVVFNGAATRMTPLRTMTPAAQTHLKGIVDGLRAGGGTNIQDGLQTGLAVLAGRVNTKGRTANVFLLTDGQQTSGDAKVVDPGMVSVYTFGFGKDAAHQLLSDVAKRSPGGTFSFVRDGANVSAPFSQLLGGLLTVVAQDVQLTLKPLIKEKRDIDTMVVAPGTDYKQSTEELGAGGVIVIKFGTLFSGEKRKVAVNMTLLDSSEEEVYDALLAEARVTYTAQMAAQRVPRELIKIRRTPNPDPAEDAATSGKVLGVLAEMARREHAESIGMAKSLADEKKLGEARGVVVKAQNAVEDIMHLDGDKAGKELVRMLRAELLHLLALMDTQEMYDAQGKPYALASVTSHGRQRYAARGGDTDDAVRLFATPRMDKYLEQAKKFEEDSSVALPSADEDVKEEVAANPAAAIRAPIAFYLKAAIEALQAIEELIAN